MPRTARSLVLFDAPYHIVSRGNGGQNTFCFHEDFVRFSNIVQETKELFHFKLYHYAFMNNHFHLMIHAEKPNDIGKILRRIKFHYAMYFKKKYLDHRHVHVWGDRYDSVQIMSDEQLLTCGIYIELNPVRANICARPEDYAWSSYQYYAFGAENSLVDEDPYYVSLGENAQKRQTEYEKLTLMWQFTPRIQKELYTPSDCHSIHR